MSATAWPSKSGLRVIAKCWRAEQRLLSLYADHNLRYMEALEAQSQEDGDVQRLRAMRDAFTRFREARGRVVDRMRQLEVERQHCHARLNWLAELGQGERLGRDAVGLCWDAFTSLLQAMPLDMALRVGRLPISAEARASCCFAAGGEPDRVCGPVPSEAHHLITLASWLKKNGYVPRVGSPAWTQLLETIEMVRTYAEARLQQHEREICEVEGELARLPPADRLDLAVIPEPKDLPPSE